MRLLNTTSLEFKCFADNDRPPYAIASHRWGADETNFKDFQQKHNILGSGHTKVLGFCQLVDRMNTHAGPSRALNDLGLRHRCDWLWIDTCCINKEDGAELSESINSMFRWYGDAAVCYAYLADVKPNQKFRTSALDLTRSQWFKRGWTLQELIAPRTVVFLANNWDILGHKCAYSDQVCGKVCQGYGDRLNKLLAQITGIPSDVIGMPSITHLKNIAVEQKLAWAQRRSTTRTEDQAYCLLGLLDVFISPIYGEGEYAWTRLMQQLEYNKQTTKFSPPGAKAAKKSHMWFRLKKVKKNVVDRGRFASQTTVSAELNAYSTMSAQDPEYSAQSFSEGPMSMSALPDIRAHSEQTPPRAPMSVPPQENYFVSQSDTPRAPMSVPPPGTYRSYSYEATSLHYTSAPVVQYGPPALNIGPPAWNQDPQMQNVHQRSVTSVPRKALPTPVESLQTKVEALHGAAAKMIVVDPYRLPPGTLLKHRYGSAWSFHTADGYQSVWYHELPGTPPVREKAIPEDIPANLATTRKVKARVDFKPAISGQLSLKNGDIIVVLESSHKDWWRGWLHGRTGLFPRSCVEELEADKRNAKGQSNTSVNVSTLAVGEEPGLDDWERHDTSSPGAWSDAQRWLVAKSTFKDLPVEEAASSNSQSGSAEAGEDGQEAVKAPSTMVRSSVRRKPIRRPTPYAREEPDHEIEDLQVRGSLDSPRWIPDLTEDQLKALPDNLRQAYVSHTRTSQMYTELSTLMYKSSSPVDLAPADPQEQTIGPVGFIESDKSVRESDERSIQSEHFGSAHWQESGELARKPTEGSVEMRHDDRKPIQIDREEKAGVFVKSTGITTEPEENITIPRVLLRALLDPTAMAHSAETSDETAQLANTAVEYIRSLLLSQSGATLPPVQQTTTTVEAYRLETSKIQQHISVAESLSTTTADSMSSLDGAEEVEGMRRQSNGQSWYLHGVWQQPA